MDFEASLLARHFDTIAEILQSFDILMGIGLMLGGFFQLKKHGENRSMMSGQHSLAGPFMMLLAGTLLLALPTFIGTALLAFWGKNSPLHYVQNVGDYSGLVSAVLIFVRIVGVASFTRGVILLSRTGGQQSQPGTLGKALIHIFAGILCVHIVGTMDLLGQILGMTT